MKAAAAVVNVSSGNMILTHRNAIHVLVCISACVSCRVHVAGSTDIKSQTQTQSHRAVQPGRGLVQEQDGLVGHRLRRDGDPPLLPARHAAHHDGADFGVPPSAPPGWPNIGVEIMCTVLATVLATRSP